MRESFRKIFGIELPIIQAPMAGVQGSALATAVSNAGGLGSLPCAMLSPEKMHEELLVMRAKTSKPYNVNFFCHTSPAPDPAQEAAWRAALAPYYQELSIDPALASTAAVRVPFTPHAAEVLDEFRPPVVSFHFGLPPADLLARVKSTGAMILACATTVEEACWLETHGANAVVAQGFEAGGHRGMFLTEDISTQSGTFALLPQVVSALKIPVVAAGGIADSSGVKAALSLGAVAAQIGTTYMRCFEATTSSLHRAALQSERSRHTVITRLFSGRPARGIVNRLVRELGAMNPVAPEFPLAASALAPLRTKAESLGDDGFSPLWCGQNATGALDVPAADLTRLLVRAL